MLEERCKGYCECCGKPLGENWAVHHRKLRSQGGQDTLSNLIAVHHECHNLGTKSIHLNVAWSVENGYIVNSWDTPQDVPIKYYGCDSVLLTDSGEVHYV